MWIQILSKFGPELHNFSPNGIQTVSGNSWWLQTAKYVSGGYPVDSVHVVFRQLSVKLNCSGFSW